MPEFDSVGTIAFFRERQRSETLLTERVLQASPADAFSYQPHVDSPTAAMTAWTIVRCLRVCNELTRHRTAEIEHDPPPSRDVLLAEFQHLSNSLASSVAEMTQEGSEAAA